MINDEKWLYLECLSGISGDMTVGALLDLGAKKEVLIAALDSLGVGGYHLHFGRKLKCGIDAYDFDVHLEDEHHEGEHHGHEHHEGEHHGHEHHGHKHAHHDCVHTHRGITDIFKIIDHMQAEASVKSMAKKMFSIVAEAESKAHGIPVEQVHFHEVGAIDSIVDIISVAVCLYDLGISSIVVSPLAEGKGYVRCQHGVMPVPVPATLNIAAAHGLELRLTDNEGEMVTPTGAAIAAAIATKKQLPSHYTIEKIGVGAGNKDFKNANILRAMIIKPIASPIWVLETNIDDSTGEALGFVMDCLLEEGARDAYYTPAFMKKGRPAYVLHVMCTEEKIKDMEGVIFTHTTTIGIRRYPVERTEMSRSIETVQTRYGLAAVKRCSLDGTVRSYPEFESVKKLCREQGLGFSEVYQAIKQDAEQK